MVLLSGEVETAVVAARSAPSAHRSGWFCYPGKLKRLVRRFGDPAGEGGFRMVLLSGEVETYAQAVEDTLKAGVPDGFAIRGS